MSAPTCSTCTRGLIARSTWAGYDQPTRKRLHRTHAPGEPGTDKCRTCFVNEAPSKRQNHVARDLAYDGGWVNVRGIMRPTIKGARDVA